MSDNWDNPDPDYVSKDHSRDDRGRFVAPARSEPRRAEEKCHGTQSFGCLIEGPHERDEYCPPAPAPSPEPQGEAIWLGQRIRLMAAVKITEFGCDGVHPFRAQDCPKYGCVEHMIVVPAALLAVAEAKYEQLDSCYGSLQCLDSEKQDRIDALREALRVAEERAENEKKHWQEWATKKLSQIAGLREAIGKYFASITELDDALAENETLREWVLDMHENHHDPTVIHGEPCDPPCEIGVYLAAEPKGAK